MEYVRPRMFASFYKGSTTYPGPRTTTHDALLENWIDMLGLGKVVVSGSFDPSTLTATVVKAAYKGAHI